jgi:protein-L-isoaspartate(D-aspartate) O-methyltransferase
MDEDNAADSGTEPRHKLVETLREKRLIRSEPVAQAFLAVPRHLFLPESTIEDAYKDGAIVTKRREDGLPISSSSQPSIMAVMLEQLDVRPGMRVLEVGAGTGYNAALLAHLAGPGGHAVTVDIDEDIVAGARAHLAAAGYGNVEVVCGDGGLGHPPGAPYDRIILTVGADDITPAWWEQLAPDGRLVLPLWLRGGQRSVAFEREGAALVSRSVEPCGFMTLRGAFAGAQGYLPLATGLMLTVEDHDAVDPAAFRALLDGPSHDLDTGISLAPPDAPGLSLWLALREPGFLRLSAEGDAAKAAGIPALWGMGDRFRFAIGVHDGDGLALLIRAGGALPDPHADGAPAPLLLQVRAFGNDATAHRVAAHIQAWDTAGRPDGTTLRIRASPAGEQPPTAPAAFLLPRRHSTFVVEM